MGQRGGKAKTMIRSQTERDKEGKKSHGLQGREREDLKDGDKELVRQRWRKQVHGSGLEGAGRKKSQKSQQCGREKDPGESLDAEETRQGPEGLALTAALALSAAGRLCCFRRFSLLLSSTPLP